MDPNERGGGVLSNISLHFETLPIPHVLTLYTVQRGGQVKLALCMVTRFTQQ